MNAARRRTMTAKRTARWIDALSELVRAFRTLQISKGHHPWLLLDMTMAQLKAVMLLVQSTSAKVTADKSGGGLTSRELADGLGIAPSAATPLVDRLVDQKLARREPDPQDRRIIWIRPTTKSVSLYDQLIQKTNRPVLEQVLEELARGDRQKVYESMLLLLEAAQRVMERTQKRRA
jgi:DNA-binding MarR family transcriptional regulator